MRCGGLDAIEPSRKVPESHAGSRQSTAVFIGNWETKNERLSLWIDRRSVLHFAGSGRLGSIVRQRQTRRVFQPATSGRRPHTQKNQPTTNKKQHHNTQKTKKTERLGNRSRLMDRTT